MASIQDLSITLPRDHIFSGRQDQLKKLQEILEKKSICVLAAAKGIPCKIGKTVLAAQLAQGKTVIWIDARKRKTLETAFQQLSAKLAVTTDRVKEVLSKMENFLIFDDVKDKELLKPYLPDGQCRVLLTSRLRDWEHPLIEVGLFPKQEAIDYLHQLTGKQDAQAAIKIAEELDCLPTSLEKAAKLIVAGHAELGDYFGLKEAQFGTHGHRLKEIGNLPPRNRNFVGRELSLVALEEAFKVHADACVVISSKKADKKRVGVETGLGGIGKTQMALQYAYRNADKYPHHVLWVNAESRATLDISYTFLAERLSIILSDEEKKEENILFKKVNSKLASQGGYLLILDNAIDQTSLTGLLPKSGGHLLITSRSPDWDLHGVHVFKVSLFTRKESIALIQKLTHLNAQDADSIAAITQDLPIAVAQAAAYIAQTQVKAEDYCKLFREKNLKLFEHQDPTDELSKRTVNVTWQISMEEIVRREKNISERLMIFCPLAEPLMNLCSFFASRDIPASLLIEWLKNIYQNMHSAEGDLTRTLELLRDFSMIDWQENLITIHPIVQLVSRNILSKENQKAIYFHAFVTMTSLLYKFDKDNTSTWDLAKLLIPHAKAISEINLMLNLDAKNQSMFLAKLGFISASVGNIYEALKINANFLNIAEAWYLENPQVPERQEIVVISYNNMGSNFGLIGQHLKALEYKNKALQVLLTMCGEKDVRTATGYNNIGESLRALGRYKEALEIEEKALEIRIKTLGEEDSNTATSYNNVGICLEELGQYEKAITFLQKALEIWKKSKETDPSIALGYHNLGSCLNKLGCHQQALDFEQKALEIRKKIFGDEFPDTALSYSSVGTILGELERHQEALPLMQKALEIRKKILGNEHPDTGTSYNNLGSCLRMLNKYDEALNYSLEALRIRENILGANHLDTAISYNSVGLILSELIRFDEAFVYLTHAANLRATLLPPKHLDIADSYNNVGLCLGKLERHQEAIAYFSKALEILKGHPHLEKSLMMAVFSTNMAENLQTLTRYEEALSYQLAAMEIEVSILGKEALDTVVTYNNVGFLLTELGKLEEALVYQQKALDIRRKTLGDADPGTINCFVLVALTLQKLERFQSALDTFQHILNILLQNSKEEDSIKKVQAKISQIELSIANRR